MIFIEQDGLPKFQLPYKIDATNLKTITFHLLSVTIFLS
jgi:hypothetical protein